MYERNTVFTPTGVVTVAMLAAAPMVVAATGDYDNNGFLDLRDHYVLEICLSISGPGHGAVFDECLTAFDTDTDQDVDLADFADFQRAQGHLPIPLRDTLGNLISADSTTPYSGRQTCAGSCHVHDISRISNGFKFQQGRTDTEGNIVMQDDFFQDGRTWQQSPGRFGHCSPAGGLRVFAGKENANESQMGMTAFDWVGQCTSCHPGGGPGEFDRDGMRLFDSATGQFGYELLGKTAADVLLDGDYASMDSAGNVQPARWDITGVSEPDCLHCHTPDPAWKNGIDTQRYTRRTAAARAMTDLVDDVGNPVPAYAAAGVAGQGWFSSMPIVGGTATKLQIDYGVGVAAGTLLQEGDGTLVLPEASLDFPPRDNACWLCHGPIGWERLRGGVWFDDRDFHYAKLNNMLDEDPDNDIRPGDSTTCTYCHPGNPDHNFAKGNSLVQHTRDELDWVGLRTCRDCHLVDSAERHPDAPPVPGTALIHYEGRMMDVLSCQACHIPSHFLTAADMRGFRDKTLAGGSISYSADVFYSANPVDPSDPDKSTWYPALYPKTDQDGITRLFPAIPNPQAYWGDWDQRGTPEDKTDDVIMPIADWRLNEILQGEPLAGVTDDNGDGQLEVNRPEEILAYIQALKANDHYGNPVATHPVLVKGWKVWFEDPDAPGGVSAFVSEEYGVKTEWQAAAWGMNHNVRRVEESLGYDPVNPELGCRDCHRPDALDSPVFDRLVLVDPWDETGQPVYQKVREMTGLNPP